jgi:hypothetical protein
LEDNTSQFNEDKEINKRKKEANNNNNNNNNIQENGGKIMKQTVVRPRTKISCNNS